MFLLVDIKWLLIIAGMSSKIVCIDSLNSAGEGVGKYEGLPLYVEGALPGEEVEVQITACRKQSASARLLKVLKPSPDRIEPLCPLFGRCGGCQIMHLSYSKQLLFKRNKVLEAFQKQGLDVASSTAACLGCESPFFYRNKVQFPCVSGDEGPLLGLYAKGSHTLIDVPTCFVHHRLGEEVYEQVRHLLKNSAVQAYDPTKKTGTLRHVLIKSALQTKQVLVVLVTNGLPDEALMKLAQSIRASCSSVRGVVHNLQEAEGNVILGKNYTLLTGEEQIEETLCGLTFQISAASFFQVNPLQAEKLYEQALTFAELRGEETVLDAYCGVGTLSLLFAQKAKQVIGVECVAEAIQNAKSNAQKNNMNNVSFVCAPSERFIATLAFIDVALLNPPRKGCDPALLAELARLSPKKIIYISCNPESQARDIAILQDLGYQLTALQPVDLFPQTSHVECVAQLKKIDSYIQN